MPTENHPATAELLVARRPLVERYLRAASPQGGGSVPDDGDDPVIASVLIDALIAEAGFAGQGRLEPFARRHGLLRARENGTVDRLLAEYGAMRLGVMAALDPADDTAPRPPSAVHAPTEPIADPRAAVRVDGDPAVGPEISIAPSEAIERIGAVPGENAPAVPALHAAIDRAAAGAAAAFNAERLRQRRAVMRGQDHELRGCLNAIWLAACVQRQSGNSSADLIERQTARMRDALDRSRQVASRPAASALWLEDLLAEDLVSACRQQAAAWNDRHRSHPCTVLLPGSCIGRFDIERIREALDGLLASAARHAGPGSALQIRMTLLADSARITVQGERPAASPQSEPGLHFADDEGPLGWLLARQTAAAHGGRLSVEHGSSGIALELTLRLPTPAHAQESGRVRPS